MNSYAANEQNQKTAESIGRQYVPRQDNKLEQLQQLDNKVKLPGRAAGGIIGTAGTLVMGAGMSQIMVLGK